MSPKEREGQEIKEEKYKILWENKWGSLKGKRELGVDKCGNFFPIFAADFWQKVRTFSLTLAFQR